ncbi:MAG: CARDB domain-containing protein, partial [Candidatus Nanohaloarchaea archaeon]
MRKHLLLLLAFAAVIPAASAAVEPVILVESVSPEPVAPGGTARVHVLLRNAGETAATFDALSVETPPGVTVTGIRGIDGRVSLCGGCQLTGTVHLAVADDVVSGTYPVALTLKRNGIGVVETVDLAVDGDPHLLVDVANTSVVPGRTVTTTVSVTNIGTATAAQVTVSPAHDRIAFRPGTVALGTVAPGETATATVGITADASLASGVQRLPVTLTYRSDATERTVTR